MIVKQIIRPEGYFSPIPPLALRIKRMQSGQYIAGSTGIEKRCPKCGDYWPIDTEFWFTHTSTADGLHTWCKACYLERRYPARYGMPARALNGSEV